MRCLALTLAIFAPLAAQAVELDTMPAEQSTGIAAALAEQANAVEKLPAKVDPDIENARGLLSLDQQHGVLVIPAKGLSEDRDNPALAEEKGAPVGLLFFHNVLPTDVEKKDKLFTFNYTDENGQEREIRFAILTIRKFSDEDFKLQVWGSEKEPLVECQLEEEVSDEKSPVEIEAVGDDLEFTWLGSYPCYLGITASKY